MLSCCECTDHRHRTSTVFSLYRFFVNHILLVVLIKVFAAIPNKLSSTIYIVPVTKSVLQLLLLLTVFFSYIILLTDYFI